MSLRRLRTRTAIGDDQGFSMVELLVVLFIMAIIGAIATGFLVNATTVTGRAENSTRADDDARVVLRSMLEDLRAAQDVAVPTSTTACPSGASYPAGFVSCIQFTVIHSNDATSAYPQDVITYGLLSDHTVREDKVHFASSTSSTHVVTGKVVLANVTNSSGQPLFTYYDTFGNQLNPTSNTTDDFTRAGFVKVSLFVTFQNNAPAISEFSTAALRNNR